MKSFRHIWRSTLQKYFTLCTPQNHSEHVHKLWDNVLQSSDPTLSHTCITGRASLARRSTPEAAKPVPPCQDTWQTISIMLNSLWKAYLHYHKSNETWSTYSQSDERCGVGLSYTCKLAGAFSFFQVGKHKQHKRCISTLCSGTMSLSDSLSPVMGSVMSFLINFSTHSWVTTVPLNKGQRLCQLSS